jgi:hypothetical protein
MARLIEQFRHHSLARELTVVLAVKFTLLGVLYAAFFSHPVAPHGGMAPRDVARAVLGPTAGPQSTARASTEIRHDR